MKLKSSTAIVTGGGSGIGRATALLFAQNGARIAIVGQRSEPGEETVKMIQAAQGEACFITANVSNASDAQKAVEVIIRKYHSIDILFNGAGIGGESAPLAEMNEEDWDKVISVNLKGTFLMSKYAVRQMLKQGKGVIINMASVAATVGMRNGSAYAASKGGVVSLTKTIALEYGRNNIRVNCICPSFVRTGMTRPLTGGNIEQEERWVRFQPIPRMGDPQEIAAAALYLASDDSSFVTGAGLTVDGGYTAV